MSLMKRPGGRTATRIARQQELQRLLGILAARDPNVTSALVVILETLAVTDRQGASRLLEAIGTLIAFATRQARPVRPTGGAR